MSFRICTIGCGGMVMGHHGPSWAKYAKTHEDTELVACCDLDESRAAECQRRFGFARRYADLVKMLKTEKPDAVCLVVPEALTCELACQVMEMGFPLLMEKPPGHTTDQIDGMIAVADAAGVATQVSFNRRYTPLMQELKRILTEDYEPADLQHVRYDFTRVGRTDMDFSWTAIHGIDSARHIAGSDYTEVRFHYQHLPELGPTTANIFMDCTFASGTTAHLNFCPVCGVTTEQARIHAHDNSFFANLPAGIDAPGSIKHYHEGRLVREIKTSDVCDGDQLFEISGFYGENASFFDDVRNGRSPAGDLRSARQAVELSECIRLRKKQFSM